MPKSIPAHTVSTNLYPAEYVKRTAGYNPAKMFAQGTLSTRYAWTLALIAAALGILKDAAGAKVTDYRAVAQAAATMWATALIAHRDSDHCPDAVCLTSRGLSATATVEQAAQRWTRLITPDAADTTQMLGDITRAAVGRGLTVLHFGYLTDANANVRKYAKGDVPITKTWRGVEVPQPAE